MTYTEIVMSLREGKHIGWRTPFYAVRSSMIREGLKASLENAGIYTEHFNGSIQHVEPFEGIDPDFFLSETDEELSSTIIHAPRMDDCLYLEYDFFREEWVGGLYNTGEGYIDGGFGGTFATVAEAYLAFADFLSEREY